MDEHRAFGFEAANHFHVVDDRPPHIDRRAVQREGVAHRVDRAVDAGAEAAGRGQQDPDLRALVVEWLVWLFRSPRGRY